MNDVPCPACNSSRHRMRTDLSTRLALQPGDAVRCCLACGFGTLVRTRGTATRYEDEYFESYASQGEMPGGIHEAPRHVEERLDALATTIGGPGRLLDVGCGYGLVLASARRLGWSVQGLDVSAWSAEHIARTLGLSIRVGDVLRIEYEPGAFDVIHMSHALEHTTSPLEVLRHMRRWVRPGGLLVIEVPNQIDELYATVRSRLLGRDTPLPVPNSHEVFFNARALRAMLGRAGYDVRVLRSERRNEDTESRLPLGTLVKPLIFGWERRLTRGPNLVAWATPST